MKRISWAAFAAAILPLASCLPESITIQLVGTYVSPNGAGSEIISIQKSTRRAALASCLAGRVEILDLGNPASPVLMVDVGLDLLSGEELTSIAFHPSADYFAVPIQSASPTGNGRVELRSASSGALLKTLTVGVGPDSIAIDADGRRAVVANEAEDFIFNPATDTFSSAPGSITVIDLKHNPAASTAVTLSLIDLTGRPGFVQASEQRMIERLVDLNGNGVIDDESDLNGDGDTDDDDVLIGTFRGQQVRGDEGDGETLLIPLTGATPDLIEPEAIAIVGNGTRAIVTLQEVNGLAIVNLPARSIIAYAGLGTTTHIADTLDDDAVSFTDTLVARRESDGVAFTSDDEFFVTADEGDTDPNAGDTPAGFAAGGGRTLSVFRASNRALVADTGNQIDEVADAAGLYPDGRSDAKGCEPEMVTIIRVGVVDFAVVALERANGVALVSLAVPSAPQVLAVVEGGEGPEGIAALRAPTGHDWYVYTADEVGGTVSVYRVTPTF